VPISQSNYEDSDTVAYPDAAYPYQNYIGPLYVVSESVFSDPSSSTGGTYNQKFYYYGAWTNLQGRGFQAFAVKRTLDSRYVSPNLLYHYEYYERSFPYTGMKYQDIESTGVFYTSGIHRHTGG